MSWLNSCQVFLDRPCSSRFAAMLSASRPRHPASSKRSLSAVWRADQPAQPQTPATENIDLTDVCGHSYFYYYSRASCGSHMLTHQPVAYISQSNDPWFNLSYEDWLVVAAPALLSFAITHADHSGYYAIPPDPNRSCSSIAITHAWS
jgi:hypothetical protein